jgi:hypothetical protein
MSVPQKLRRNSGRLLRSSFFSNNAHLLSLSTNQEVGSACRYVYADQLTGLDEDTKADKKNPSDGIQAAKTEESY